MVTAQSTGDYEMVVPLCSYDLEPLEVRCLLEMERPDSLLETYLRVTEVPCTRQDGITLVPTARSDNQFPVQTECFSKNTNSCFLRYLLGK